MTTIVVIAKEPRPGRVKTRLCPPCTPEEAAAIAAAALHDTLSAVARTAGVMRVLALDGESGPWLPPGFTVVGQAGGDLGARLAAAVEPAIGPVLVVGMDTPQVTPEQLDDACRRLWEPGTDAVIGPAPDGGYWAIGFRGRRHGAFDGVPMSTATTANHQRRRLDRLGLRHQDLSPLRDVDTFADARAVSSEIPTSAFARAVANAQTAIEVAA